MTEDVGKPWWRLYKKKKINPLGGCLPILVQMPVFFLCAGYYGIRLSYVMHILPLDQWLSGNGSVFHLTAILMGLSMMGQQMFEPNAFQIQCSCESWS